MLAFREHRSLNRVYRAGYEEGQRAGAATLPVDCQMSWNYLADGDWTEEEIHNHGWSNGRWFGRQEQEAAVAQARADERARIVAWLRGRAAQLVDEHGISRLDQAHALEWAADQLAAEAERP